jgi:preprotein translocase subunit YajC
MKSSFPGLLITGIFLFNIICLLLYFLMKFRKHDQRMEEKEENKDLLH